ncbi:CinA family protein [bacterium]|nr:CinA family protein [bacterium]
MSEIQKLGAILKEKKIKISGAESCTGGMVAAEITSVDGISAVFSESFVTYSNDSKHRNLGVQLSTLEKFGAVSEECAREMAEGAAARSGADIAFSVTGIAGPTGGTAEKPVGTVCFGLFFRGKTVSKTAHFEGDREKVRKSSVDFIINMLISAIIN